MILFPNAKINIGLFVTSKRADGYHNLETIFNPVMKLCDILEVITSNKSKDEFTVSGLNIDGSYQDNLCMKALKLMRTVADIPPLKIHLHKIIPFGAGLGGGSADAAFMIKLLNEQYNIGLNTETLEEKASGLGADCPVFVQNKPALAKGIGNEFYDTNINLIGYWLQIVVPPSQVSTAMAYSKLTPKQPGTPLEELIKMPITEWAHGVKNDFEPTVFSLFPEIKEVKNKLYNNGALYASMSGSGSAVYGIFIQEPENNWNEGYTVHNEQIN